MDARRDWGDQVVSARLFVEGGGDNKALKAVCRRGFREFIEKAGAAGRISNIVPCGSRGNAFNSFRAALNVGESALLLVDAEGPVTAQGAWQHLKVSDNWDRPANATDAQCHLMVQVMESWFLADADALASFYGQGFNRGALPANPNIEQVSKGDALAGLDQAARNTGKGGYKKGPEGYDILARLDPGKVRNASPFAECFVQALSGQG